MDRFWMICRAPAHRNSRTEPKARFPTLDAARDEARRLAYQTGHPFVVLAVVEEVRPKDNLTGRLPF